MLVSLEALWNGPLSPSDLEEIEEVLRAFLLADKLIPSHATEAIVPYKNGKKISYFKYSDPFEDHLLDYEFVQPNEEFFVKDIAATQTGFLAKTTKQWVELFTQKILDEEVRSKRIVWSGKSHAGESLEYDRDKWLASFEVKQSMDDLPDSDYDHNIHEKLWSFIYSEGILHMLQEFYLESRHAEDLGYFLIKLSDVLFKAVDYYVSCHRSGMIVFSNSLPGVLCKEFVFSKWPNEIFRSLEQDYSKLMRNLRGPSVGIDLPPLILIVLSIAERREDIPRVIVELRDSYTEARADLWLILTKMWETPSLKEQIEILNTLQSATEGILPNITGSSVNYLSLGLDLARFSTGGLASAGKNLLDINGLEKKVSAITFTKQVSSDLTNNAMNVKKVIERHLTQAEKNDFGY